MHAARRFRLKKQSERHQIDTECSELEERNQRLRMKLEELQREKDLFIQTVSGTLYKKKGAVDLPLPFPMLKQPPATVPHHRTVSATMPRPSVQSSDGEDDHDTSFDSSSQFTSSQETNLSRVSYGRQFSNSSYNDSESSYGSSGAVADESDNFSQGLSSSQSTTEGKEKADSRVAAEPSRGPVKSSQHPTVLTSSVEPSKPISRPLPGNTASATGGHAPRPTPTTTERSDSFITLEEFAALTQRLHEAESQLQAQRTNVTVTSTSMGEVQSTPPAKVLVKRTGGVSTLLPSSIVKTEVKTEIKTEPEEAIVINSDSDSEHAQRPSKPSTPGPVNVNVNVNLNFQDVPGLDFLMTRGRSSSTSSQQGDGYDDIDTNEIPFSLDQIANASSTQLKAMIEESGLTEYQQNIVRLVRRRIQNKIAAQTARRRKMDYLNSLRTEVFELRQRRGRLVQEKDTLSSQLSSTSQNYDQLYEQVFTKMTDDAGRPYSADEYKLEVSPVGVVLVRKDTVQTIPPRDTEKPETSSGKS